MIFQSTLPRGERLRSVSYLQLLRHFNPRSREGSDVGRLLCATHRLSFQSTLPRGERLNSSHRWTITSQFQSTLPRGERLHRQYVICNPFNFNPRSREGSDCKNTQTTNIISVYFYLYYIIFVSLATNTAYITITKPSKCRCESPYTFC